MKTTVKIEGLKDVQAALSELPKATGKNVLRRVLRKRAQPMAQAAAANAPVEAGTLKASIGVGTKLTRRQAAQHRKMFANDRASVEIFVGAGGLPQAHLQEFGTSEHAPQPFLRPAFDAHKDAILDGVKDDLWSEIDKAAKRLAKKLAKQSAG